MKKRFVMAGLPFFALTGFIYAMTAAHSAPSGNTVAGLGADTLRRDPVCNMKVDDQKGDTLHYKGHIFGFCSKGCRASFLKAPDSYLPKKN